MNIKNWLRFKRDIKYDLLVPPLGLDFYKLTPKQAQENFDWYISKIPERVEYLRNRCASDLKISAEILDFSGESLKVIWRWFLKMAKTEKTSKYELAKMRKKFGHFGESFINKARLSVATEYMIRDIGMYVGEVYVRNYPSITWSFHSKPKNDFFVNRPLLVGFVNENYSPPFKAKFEPIHMVGVQATKLYNHTQKETDLYDIFVRWLGDVPKSESIF